MDPTNSLHNQSSIKKEGITCNGTNISPKIGPKRYNPNPLSSSIFENKGEFSIVNITETTYNQQPAQLKPQSLMQGKVVTCNGTSISPENGPERSDQKASSSSIFENEREFAIVNINEATKCQHKIRSKKTSSQKEEALTYINHGISPKIGPERTDQTSLLTVTSFMNIKIKKEKCKI